jgi:hypothetical protein
MLRDRGPADREIARQLPDRLWALKQSLEDCAPRRITERIQLRGMLVSNH